MNTDNLIYFYLTLGVLMLALLFGVYVTNKIDTKTRKSKN